MFLTSHKAKQYLLVALKVLILVGTFYYIYFKLKNTPKTVQQTILATFNIEAMSLFVYGIYFCFLVAGNWLFEILKWKYLVSSIQKISFFRAVKESLTSLTISLATPNRIGEYGAKALFYPAEKRKKIMLLNFIGNGFQMAITTFFGTLGLVYLTVFFDVSISFTTTTLVLAVILLFIALAFFFKERELLLKGFTINKVMIFFRNVAPTIKLKTFLFSVIRYGIFSLMFLELARFFGVQINLYDGLAGVFSMYLLSSVIPTVFILDIAVKGSIAVFLFSLIGVSEIPILCTVLLMWLLNMVFPAIIGSIFLFSLKKSSS